MKVWFCPIWCQTLKFWLQFLASLHGSFQKACAEFILSFSIVSMTSMTYFHQIILTDILKYTIIYIIQVMRYFHRFIAHCIIFLIGMNLSLQKLLLHVEDFRNPFYPLKHTVFVLSIPVLLQTSTETSHSYWTLTWRCLTKLSTAPSPLLSIVSAVIIVLPTSARLAALGFT